MINNGFKYLCELGELTENKGKRFEIDDVDVAVFKINDKVFALSNICPHQLQPKIYNGFLEDDIIYCPIHSWGFNVRTGKKTNGSGGLKSYETKIDGNKVYVKVFKQNLNW